MKMNKVRLFSASLGLVFGLFIVFYIFRNLPIPSPIKIMILATSALVGAILPREEINYITSEEAGHNQHGSSRWATEKEEHKQFEFVSGDNPTSHSIVIGVKHKKYEIDTSDQNISLIAPPGSGKTKRIIIPTIIYNCLVNKNTDGKGESMVITYLKGELLISTEIKLQACLFVM